MVMPTKGPWIVPSSSRSAFAISSHPLVRQVHNGSGEGLSSTLNEPGLARCRVGEGPSQMGSEIGPSSSRRGVRALLVAGCSRRMHQYQGGSPL